MNITKHKKILFLINGFGLGNCTRSEAIIEELTRIGYQISIATSNNGLTFFQSKSYPLFKMKNFKYGQTKNKISIFKTLLSVPQIFLSLISNYFYLLEILKNNSFDAIVSDSDYTVAGLALTKHPPLIAINNSSLVISDLKKRSFIPRSIRGHLWIERLDAFFHQTFPDLVISPSLSKNLFLQKNIHVVPPIVREGFKPCPPSKKIKKILVMLSGSDLKINLNALLDPKLEEFQIKILGQNEISKKNIQTIKPPSHNLQLLKEADLLVINSGFSSISEAYYLQKPVVILPIPCHAEQYLNAQVVEQIGFGVIADEINLADKIIDAIKKYHLLRQNILKNDLKMSGALLAASLIHKSILERHKTFTQTTSFHQAPPGLTN